MKVEISVKISGRLIWNTSKQQTCRILSHRNQNLTTLVLPVPPHIPSLRPPLHKYSSHILPFLHTALLRILVPHTSAPHIVLPRTSALHTFPLRTSAPHISALHIGVLRSPTTVRTLVFRKRTLLRFNR